MTLGGNEKLALIPLILCLVLWLFPTNAPSAALITERSNSTTEARSRGDEALSVESWKPGVELIWLGILTSASIYCTLRVQDRLQDRARQTW